jgi:hypothetical protein
MTQKSHPESREEHSNIMRNRAEWSGILTGPIVWLVNLQTTYALVHWACLHKQMFPLRLAALFFLALTAAAGIVSLNIFQKLKDEARVTPPEDIARQRFMVILGMMSSALFALAIIAQGLATFFINPCWD